MQPRIVGGMEQIVELPQSQARDLLDEWHTMMLDRAARVRTAYASGLSKSEIAVRMGLARSTVYADLRGVTR